MKCPNCGAKMHVADTVNLPNGDEVYRLRFCKECGELVYTTEYVVEKTDSFMKSWQENHRDYTRNRKTNRRSPRYTEAELKYIKKNCNGNCKVVAATLGRSVEGVRKKMAEFRKEKKK